MPERLSEGRDALTILNEAVNAECSCGGAGPTDGCMACRVWHRAKSAMRAKDSTLDAERQAHAVTRAEVERLRTRIADIGRNLHWPEPEKATSADVLYAAFRAIKDRDEARRDAVELWDSDTSRLYPSEELEGRIAGYREAQETP